MGTAGEQMLRDKYQTNGIRVGQKLTPLLSSYVDEVHPLE